MNDKPNITSGNNILGVRFDMVDYESVFSTIERWRRTGRRDYVTITNPHSAMLCRRDGRMRKATKNAGMTLPDGVGVAIASSLLGYRHSGRVTGPTLMLRLCDWGRRRNYRHYFLGGAAGVVEKLAGRLSRMFPGLGVAGTHSPPFRELTRAEDRRLVERISSAAPDILWVGLGAPKQEKWMLEHVGEIRVPAMIGVGAAFDFHSGNVKWAPRWVRKAGLEWAYRLAREPGRMWRRNLDSPAFLAGVIGQRFVTAARRKRKAKAA